MLGRTEVSWSSDFTEVELSDDEDTFTGSRISSRYRERGKTAVVSTMSREYRVTGVEVLMAVVTGPHSNLCPLFPCGLVLQVVAVLRGLTLVNLVHNLHLRSDRATSLLCG
jgi:hypothetical protein